MIAVVQRVTRGRVTVAGQIVGEIGHGLVVLVSVHADDTDHDIQWTANKLVNLRIFTHGDKFLDLDLRHVQGALLLVSNFTVAAETRSGRRPGLSAAAGPEKARPLFDALVTEARMLGVPVQTGQFGADMRVEIDNDGPVTLIVDSRGSRG
jgi:D-tyrosyl-tRNA(Tyr) deacylase